MEIKNNNKVRSFDFKLFQMINLNNSKFGNLPMKPRLPRGIKEIGCTVRKT